MKALTLTVTVDADYIRLIAYEMVLRQIAEQGMRPVWERDADEAEPHELAEAALRAFGEDGA